MGPNIHEALFDAAVKALQQTAKPRPRRRAVPLGPKEKEMKTDLKLFRITIAARLATEGPSNDLDDGCELLVLGTNGEDVCAKILDELPDSPHVAYPRIKITEIEGPFDHGTILSWRNF